MLCGGSLFAQSKAKAQNVPEIPSEIRPFLKMPAGLYLGEAMGVATNSKGHLFVYVRSATTRLFEFDQNGAYVREIGAGSYALEFAHSVRVDPQDNIWVVDEGTNLVVKFNPAGRVMMVLGHRPEAVAGAVATPTGPAPPAEKYVFGRPTDVAWDPQGNIFVSDGYTNHRVVKYDKDGRFLAQVGSEKAGTEPGQLNLPHGLAVDLQGNVYVADRSNTRLAGVRQQPQTRKPSTTTSAIPGARASRPARTSTSSRPTPIPTAMRRGRGTTPGKSTRWNWTARSSASSATPASSPAGSRSCT